MKRIVVWSVLAAVALVLGGCGLLDGDSDADPGAPPTESDTKDPIEGPDDEPSPTRTISLEAQCTESDPQLAPHSLDEATWDTPSDFVSVTGYTMIDSPEGDYEVLWYVPDTGYQGLDIIAMVHWPDLAMGPVVDDCGAVDEKLATHRLDEYIRNAGTERLEGPTTVDVDGAVAFEELIRYDDYGFDLRLITIYGQSSMFTIGCQWTQDPQTIADACDEILESFRING